jgi:NAD(P)-dependent dehydrogenase (short-subunit alcohol dehydrogenase family)
LNRSHKYDEHHIQPLRQFETNFFGMLRISKAFAPVLATNGGGALLNVLSIVSWVNGGALAAYAASKSAAWSLTNSLRHELAAQKTHELALHMAFVDTDLVRTIDGPKTSPDDIVASALDGLEAGQAEGFADERTRLVKQGLWAARASYLPQPA